MLNLKIHTRLMLPWSAICGGSVLNQNVVLTAGHCLDSCIENPRGIEVRYGHEEIKKMNKTKAKNYVNHHEYHRAEIVNDIGLVITVERIPLDDVVKRVIIMRSPPNERKAYVAGWGLDEFRTRPDSLKHTSAIIQPAELCRQKIMAEDDDPTTFCAGPVNDTGAADRGDSGSALMIHRAIQIGIVSYQISPWTLVVYTNVSYYMDWIQEAAKTLYCAGHDNSKQNDTGQE
nr:trypsin Tyr p 3.0101-like isoform X3 [Plodia interpunctella]